MYNTGNYLRHGINITEAVPSIPGNGNMIIVGDSQMSPRATFPEGGGTSVHRLPGNQCEMSHFQLLWEPVTCV